MPGAELPADDGPLQIQVSYDRDAGTITVADNGIGMSRREVTENIGPIARSGTREFLHALGSDRRGDATLIGQFGAGFYSSFIVAERVALTTRRPTCPPTRASAGNPMGGGEYTLEAAECQSRGTTIVLKLRPGEGDLLNEYRLRSIIQKYSGHISLPIVMSSQSTGTAAEPTVNQASRCEPDRRASSARLTTAASTGIWLPQPGCACGVPGCRFSRCSRSTRSTR